ncbi:MAG: hypothetical protein NXI22_08165 [bacterium]|nr:hypothetical protein [bacterium]
MNNSLHRAFYAAVGLFILMVLSGCSFSTDRDVAGSVSINGAPLNRGVVSFVDQAGKIFVATIHENGEFSLSHIEEGEYQVAIEVPKPRGASKVTDPARPPRPNPVPIPQRYASTNTSGLTYSIDGETDKVTIELTK